MVPFQFDDAAELQQYPTYERLAITAKGSLVDLLLELIGDHPGPFRLLVVMIEGFGVEEGRYALDDELEPWQLHDVTERYRRFIEVDGRHHFWINSADNQTKRAEAKGLRLTTLHHNWRVLTVQSHEYGGL